MPVDQKRMSRLKKQYGKEKGERIYYALEQKEKSKRKRGRHKTKKGKNR